MSNITTNTTISLNWTDQLALFSADFLFNNVIMESIDAKLASFVLMGGLAVYLVHLGSYGAVLRPKNARTPNPYHPLFVPFDNDCDPLGDEVNVSETSALFMPFVAGTILLGMYYGIKNLSKELLQKYLNYYIIITSVFSNFSSLNFVFTHFLLFLKRVFGVDVTKIISRSRITWSNEKLCHPLGFVVTPDKKSVEENDVIAKIYAKSKPDIVEVEDQTQNLYYSSIQLAAAPLAIVLSYGFYSLNGSGNWLFSNLISFNFAIFGIQATKVPSFKIATILLTGLFFYDIYFVFGTDVMLTVASSIDIPIKLNIPNSRFASDIVSLKQIPMSMLGLGDVVVPALFISLCLRFDMWLYHERNPDVEFHLLHPYPTFYYKLALFMYSVALIITMGVLYMFQHGQPALLYIVPCLLAGVFSVAWIRGDFGSLWSYNEADEVVQPETEEEEEEADFTDDEKSKMDTTKAFGQLAFESEDEEDDDYVVGEDDDEEDEFDLTIIDEEEYYDDGVITISQRTQIID